MKSIPLKFCLLILGLGALHAAQPQPQKKLAPTAPLFEGLGNLHHPITTASPRAQRYFNQGLTLCFAFNHKEAIRSFQAALAEDPTCAMAYWGVSYAHGPHVNKPMSPEEAANAWTALKKAQSLEKNANATEKAYIRALSKRYEEKPQEDRSALDKAYANAMRELVREFPDDLDALTLFAEALMDTMPWDYWTKQQAPKPETEEVMAVLREVLKRDPNHPGANHFYIHAVEAGPNPEHGLPSAGRLLHFAPQAGHLVHMPSHIYLRVGQYRDARVANELAVKADQSYLAACRAQGFYPGAYYPHNVHFLWYANLFEGRSAEALAAAKKVADYERDASCGITQVVEAPRFRHLPWITLSRFGRWDEILRTPRPAATNTYLIDRAMWHFTRGLAFAARQDTASARQEHTELKRLIQREDAKALDNPQFPATAILAVADHFLAGKIDDARGDFASANLHLGRAVEAEDALPYMEPAFWPFSTRPALGASLFRAGLEQQAEQVFRADLAKFPRNAWALFGLEKCLRAQGKTDSANRVQREFATAWQEADFTLDLKWF